MLKHNKLAAWLEKMKDLCQPDAVVICDGSTQEYNRMWGLLLDAGVAKKLNEEKKPNSYLVRASREPHLYLFRRRTRCGAEQQLDRT